MNKLIKGILLILTLLLPVLIFLFLKFFGENRFDIPVYYEEGASTFSDCNNGNQKPFVIDGITSTLPGLFVFMDSNGHTPLNDIKNTTTRINNELKHISINAFNRIDSQTINQVTTNYLDSAEFITMMHCKFVTDTLNQFVLVDSKKQIRGYYRLDREEIDRLIVEVKILLENEQQDAK